eukprot:TRINITY_DN2685_c0_g1_i1.p1 TRINITY_DN2685_c0_g1~~TRINITY_DN2685_c0_g1_i1.p1  ORF type:complete len:316 (+),score=82.98 TRINITY_DN2685_c0_g1_i1:77-1024(+)
MPPKAMKKATAKAKAMKAMKIPKAMKAAAKKKPAPKKGAKAMKSAPKAMKRSKLGKIDRDRIFAIVPARSGSKGVKGKNIKIFCGKPLMAWAIDNAKHSKYIKRVFVSTDSEDYQKVALEHGAEAPFLRPADISHDTATDYQCFDHFIRWMKENDVAPSLIVQLRATAPCCTTETVDACIEEFLKHEDEGFDSLRTVTKIHHEAFNMYKLDPHETTRLLPLIKETHHKDDGNHIIKEPQSVARQILPQLYWHNAYVDIMRPETILEQGCCMGERCLPFFMGEDETDDIDNAEQWEAAEKKKTEYLKKRDQAAATS